MNCRFRLLAVVAAAACMALIRACLLPRRWSCGPRARRRRAYPPGKALPDSAKITLQPRRQRDDPRTRAASERCVGPAPSPRASGDALAMAASKRARFGAHAHRRTCAQSEPVEPRRDSERHDVRRRSRPCRCGGRTPRKRPSSASAPAPARATTVDWPAGKSTIAWPAAAIKIADGSEYQLALAGGTDIGNASGSRSARNPATDVTDAAQALIAARLPEPARRARRRDRSGE